MLYFNYNKGKEMISMVAKVSTTTIAQFKLSDDEVAVLETAYELIDNIHSTLDEGETIVSKDTGESIAWNEFSRVKGILSGIIEHNGVEWDVQE